MTRAEHIQQLSGTGSKGNSRYPSVSSSQASANLYNTGDASNPRARMRLNRNAQTVHAQCVTKTATRCPTSPFSTNILSTLQQTTANCVTSTGRQSGDSRTPYQIGKHTALTSSTILGMSQMSHKRGKGRSMDGSINGRTASDVSINVGE